MQASHDQIKAHLSALYDELMAHDGYAELSLDIRILKRGQKEVVIRCGRQFRYVVNVDPVADRPHPGTGPRHDGRRGHTPAP